MAATIQVTEIFADGTQTSNVSIIDEKLLTANLPEFEPTTKTVSTSVDPQVRVDGVDIALPLSEEDTRLCIHVSQPTTLGRRIWELQASDVEICNPDFMTQVEEVARQAGFRAELSNLYLYEEGAVVEAHENKINVQLSSPTESGSRFVFTFSIEPLPLKSMI